MQTFIYAMMICQSVYVYPHSTASECYPPDNGAKIFQSADECENFTGYINRANAQKGHTEIQYKCFKKAVNAWQPAD